MKYLKNFPFIEFITLVTLHLFLTTANFFYTFGIYFSMYFRNPYPKQSYTYLEAFRLCERLNIFLVLTIISSITLFLILELSNKSSILKFLYANKSSNFTLLLYNILLLILSMYFFSLGATEENLSFILPLFAYFSTSAGQFTVFILLWRLLDKFKDKTFAIKLRNLKKKFYAKISKKLFKAYIKNKLIRKEIEKDLTTQKTSLKNS